MHVGYAADSRRAGWGRRLDILGSDRGEDRLVKEEPEVKYLVRDGARIAYGVFGSGPIDLVVNLYGTCPIDLMWDLPQLAQFMDTLGSHARVIAYDHRGSGASDPLRTTDGAAGVESATADLLAVLDTTGADRPSLLDFNLSGLVFAAVTHPDRVHSIVGANLRSSYPEVRGMTSEQLKDFAVWNGSTKGLEALNPRVAHDPVVQRWWGRAHRLSASPEEFARLVQFGAEIDVESLLEHVRVPTLIFHRKANRIWDIETSRAAAARIPNCRFVELAGSESDLFLGDTGPVLEEITRFLEEADVTPIDDDRLLATVLFTDIASSTEQLVTLGDKQWRMLLNEHDRTVDRIVGAFRGRVIKKLGDGVLATFDGPARAVRCAAAIRDAVADKDLAVRAGLHTGEIELRAGDVAGLAVHVASRISSLAGSGEILVSRTVADLTSGSGITYNLRGDHELKGVPGRWQLFAAQVPPTSGYSSGVGNNHQP